MSSLEVLENTNERELRITISEAEFFAWRDKKPEFQDAIGIDRPAITVKSEAEIQELLSSSDTITVMECLEVMYKNKSMRNRMANSGWNMPRRIWETLDDETREKVHAMAYMDSSYSIRVADSANRLNYQIAYFGPLMPYAALNLTEEVKEIAGSSAAELSEAYGEQLRSDLRETQRIIGRCYRKLHRQITDGKFPFLDTESALERMERIQFRIQDPLSFRQEWRKIDTGDHDPRDIKAYYLENAHAVVMPTVWGERDMEGVKQIVMHELFHALGAASYLQEIKSGQVFIKRLGLAGFVQINRANRPLNDSETSKKDHTNNEQTTVPQEVHIMSEEGRVEGKACTSMGRSPNSQHGFYTGYREVLREKSKLARRLRPDIDYEDLIDRAHFEKPQTERISPDRWPNRKALGRAEAEIFGPGFSNRLDNFAAVQGVAVAIQALRTDWRSIKFDRSKNHQRDQMQN